jgi:hypothetical protein
MCHVENPKSNLTAIHRSIQLHMLLASKGGVKPTSRQHQKSFGRWNCQRRAEPVLLSVKSTKPGKNSSMNFNIYRLQSSRHPITEGFAGFGTKIAW